MSTHVGDIYMLLAKPVFRFRFFLQSTIFLSLLLLCDNGEAQHLRLGIIGGTSITKDYSAYYAPEFHTTLPDGTTRIWPGYAVNAASRSVIGGPTLTWEFNDRIAIETNAIYRRLRLEGIGPTVTWQFPVLAKYRFSAGPVRPFIEAGPSFRTTGNLNTEPSHTGFSAGAGIGWTWRGFQLAPTVRYTRWATDQAGTVPSKQDQVETLLAISRSAFDNRHPLGRRVRLGVAAGYTLIQPQQRTLIGHGTPTDAPYDPFREYLRNWILAPRIHVGLGKGWELLTEANYRQVRFREDLWLDFIDSNGVHRQGINRYEGKQAVLWQFPVLLRYGFGKRAVQPFLEAGPSFRLPQDLGYSVATKGLTAGVGVRFRWRGLCLDPSLRFSHWGPARDRRGDVAPFHFRRNQFDFMVGATF